jgi:hypothetical protein
VIYLDPFRATGRLHAAATLVHELSHIERYRARGFHAHRAAGVLSKDDFVMLGLADELAACQAEANLVQSFLESLPSPNDARRAARDALRTPELRWPPALTTLLGIEGPPDRKRRIREARRNVVLDLAGNARRYWDSRHMDSPDPVLRQRIVAWHGNSTEWKTIERDRPDWKKAEELAANVFGP